METVGVRELKARLSAWLRRVRAGEAVLITDRNRVVAELRPVGSRRAPASGLSAALDGLAEEGEIVRSAVRPASGVWRITGLGLEREQASEILEDARGDRLQQGE